MNKTDMLTGEDRLEPPLLDAVEAVCNQAAPDEAVDRSVARALQLAHPHEHSVRIARRQLLPWPRIARGRLTFALAAVAAMLLVAVVWNRSGNSVLADVVQAIAKKSWMRATGTGPNGIDIETWYSPQSGILASRQGTQRIFVNVRQQTMDVYSDERPGDPFVSRLPIERDQQKLFASGERALEMLFFGNPIKAFQGGQQELLSHTQKTVRDGESTFIEHQFTTRIANEQQQMVTILRVENESHLPVSWRSVIGTTELFSCRVDFPPRGPQTIYAMGVPRDVEIVDQTPSDDLRRILEAWKAGRTHFDTYRAVVVESNSPNHYDRGSEIYQVWRKGIQWRVDQLRMPPRLGRGPFEDEVPPNADPRSWWLARGEHWKAIPKTVCDGTREIRLEPTYDRPVQTDPDNPRYSLIKALEPHRTNTFSIPTTDPRPRQFRVMPEFQANPFLFGAGNWGYDTVVLPHPPHGPEGTVLVEAHKRNPSPLQGRIRGARYWAEPARNYAVKQIQWLKTGEPESTRKDVVEMWDLEMSPSGLWYPAVVREVQNSVNLDTGATSDTFLRFYVDFDAEISDTLFDVHKWGPIK